MKFHLTRFEGQWKIYHMLADAPMKKKSKNMPRLTSKSADAQALCDRLSLDFKKPLNKTREVKNVYHYFNEFFWH